MTPSLPVGIRKRFTSTDWAGMSDLGWQFAAPGDANADGTIDFNDLVALAQNYNTADGQRRWSQGDFNFDGNVDFSDLVLLAQNYNTATASGAAAASLSPAFAADWDRALASVPEPSTLAIGGVVWALGGVRRRRPRPVSAC